VLPVVAVVHGLGLVALVAAAETGAPTGVLAVLAGVAGSCLPQLPGAMRSLWGSLVADEQARQAAYALVAITFEVAVITAPVIVAGLVTIASPAAAVLTGGAFASGAAIAFSFTGASRRWRGERHEIGWAGPLVSPGMRVVTVAVGGFGAAIGVLQVAVPAFMAERGAAETGGLLLACLSVGSLTGGLVYGARTWPGTLRVRLVAILGGLAAVWAVLALAGSPVALGLGLVAGGLLLAPATVVGSHLLDHVAPPGTVTEAFGVMVMGLVMGTAVGAALGGQLVDGPGFAAAMLAASGVCLLGSLAALRIP
jgi:hypothetical protein